ncbi:MAG: hypothetical protein HFI43_13695 [Lachnospiraceae bacterium]|jgi:hypothetical protein|nr:hypothetical protein [Lachnospiraceae bacterium]
MAKHIKNMNELAKALQPTLLKMTDQLADRVYETLNYYLLNYYTGWTPSSYRRTEDFLHSVVKVNAHPYKGGVKASVYIDYESMDNYVNATGFQVATWANQGKHGGLSVKHKPHVWQDTMDNTVKNGELLKLAVEYLKSRGISVRN